MSGNTTLKRFQYVSVPHNIARVTEVVGHTTSTFMYIASKQNKILGPGAIAGIVIGVLAGVALLGVGAFFLWRAARAGKLRCCRPRGVRYQQVEAKDQSKLIFNDDQW